MPETRKIQQRCLRLDDLAPPEFDAGVEVPMPEPWTFDMRLVDELLGVRATAIYRLGSHSAWSSAAMITQLIRYQISLKSMTQQKSSD